MTRPEVDTGVDSLTGHYMAGAWIDTDAPLYLIRQFGQGENIVRNGDVVQEVVSGNITQPDGPMWLSAGRMARLTEEEKRALKQLKVDVRPIPVTTVRGAPKVSEDILRRFGGGE